MKRRQFLSSALTAAGAGLAAPRRPPNVVIIVTDDQGYGDLSIHGNPRLATPNIDSIAREGVQFTQFQVCPVCSPTRSSLLTGRYNYRTGIVDTYLGRSMMYAGEVTAAESFGKAGYRTGIFGKWHLGDNYPMRAIDQGFQEAVVCKGGGIGQPSDPPGNHYFDPVLFHNGNPQKYGGYCTDIFFGEALRWIGQQRREPFFAYIAPNAPHDPLQVADQWVAPFRGTGLPEETAKVYGMVANIDENVGKLLAKLRALEIDRETIVVFLTDNGPQHDRYNGGMRGRKGTVYQGGIRVPFFLRWPERLKPGGKIGLIAAHIDVLPTLLDLGGIGRPSLPQLDGRSLAPLLGNEAAAWPDRTLFTQWHRGDVPELFRACAARTQQYKLIDGKELYDLSADANEQNDIAARDPDVVRRLRRQTEEWFKDVSSASGYAPPRIHLGTPHENPVTLTRQDWRGPDAGWTPGSIGHWEVHVAKGGRYEVTIDMAPAPSAVRVAFQAGAAGAEAAAAREATHVRFEHIELQPGDTRLEVVVRAGSSSYGADYVHVRRL